MRIPEPVQTFVRRQQLGFVATVNADGTPNLSPKGTTTVWDDEHLVFAEIESPQTVANLRERPSVEVNVVDPFLRKGWRFSGWAEVIDEGVRFDQIVAWYRANDKDVHRVRTVVLIAVDRLRPLVSPVYESGASESEVVARWEAYWTGTPRR